MNFRVNDAVLINNIYDAVFPNVDAREPEWLVKRELYVTSNYAYHGELSNLTIQAIGSQPKITIIYDPHTGDDGTILIRFYGLDKYKQYQPDKYMAQLNTPARKRDMALLKAITDFIERHNIQMNVSPSEVFETLPNQNGEKRSYV